MCKILLANELTALYESPEPGRIFAYTPRVGCVGERLADRYNGPGGPRVVDLPGPWETRGEGFHARQGILWTSDDRGRRWIERTRFPFMHTRPLGAT